MDEEHAQVLKKRNKRRRSTRRREENQRQLAPKKMVTGPAIHRMQQIKDPEGTKDISSKQKEVRRFIGSPFKDYIPLNDHTMKPERRQNKLRWVQLQRKVMFFSGRTTIRTSKDYDDDYD